MKTLKNGLFVLLISLAIVSCKKDDDGGDGNDGGDVGTLTATVGGASFSGSIVATASESNAGGNSFVTLQGSDASGKAIIMIINGFNGPGTYEISSENTIANTASYIEANASNPSASKTWAAPYEDSGMVGKITVSERTDTTIKGTFNFKGKEQMGTTFKEITAGQFNLEFQ